MDPRSIDWGPAHCARAAPIGQNLQRVGPGHRKRALRGVEEQLIRAALERTGGNRTRAAELLEISHRALLYKIKEYGL